MATRHVHWRLDRVLVLASNLPAEQVEDAGAKVATAEYVIYCKKHGITIPDDFPPVIIVNPTMFPGHWKLEAFKDIEVTDEH